MCTPHFTDPSRRCSATLFPFFGGDLAAKGHYIIYNAIPVKAFFLSKSITICSIEANAALWLIREFSGNGATYRE
jgi:hypothetical protein